MVSLVRPGAVTHGFNQAQRYLPLTFTRYASECRLDAWAPPDSNWAPPGDYLLFIVKSDSVPAIGKWVRLKHMTNPSASTCTNP